MPNNTILEQKKTVVAQLSDKLKSAKSAVLVDYKGITVEQDTQLRKMFREAGVEYSVIKNTLINLAAKDAGFDKLTEVLSGTTSVALSSSDSLAPAKTIGDFLKENANAVKFKAGVVDGNIVDVNELDALSKLPSKEELLTKVLYCLNANVRNLAIVLNQIAEKGGAEQQADA